MAPAGGCAEGLAYAPPHASPHGARVVTRHPRLSALALLLASPALAADHETRICTPHADEPIALVDYAPASTLPAVTAQLLPRLPDGTPVAWGTPNAQLLIACSGMSTAAQWCGQFAGQLRARVGAQVGIVKATAYGVTTREWADPADPSWAAAEAAVAKVGAPAQVVLWLHTHTVTYWATRGPMTAAMVAATMANAKARFPSIALFVNLDHPYSGTGWRVDKWGNPGAAGISSTGLPYAAGTLTKHPPMLEIAHDGAVLKAMAETQHGVPLGSYAEYLQVATPSGTCGHFDPDDGVHLTPKSAPNSGAVYYGTGIADWLAWWPVFRSALPWLP